MMKTDNITHVLGLLVRKLDIPVTFKSVKTEIGRHPNCSNLLAISDILNTWNIPNAAYELTFEELMGTDLDAPFLAFYMKGEAGFVLVNKINQDNVILSDKEWSNHSVSIDDFKRNYLGSILIAEKDAESGERYYKFRRRKERLEEIRTPLLSFCSILVLLVFLRTNPSYASAFSWQILCLTLFKTAGLIVSVLLLIQGIDQNNPLIQKFCGTNPLKSCNAILSSKASKITDQLSWSEVGFFYFAGTWLVLLFNANNYSVMQLLAILNLLGLPYTVFSIYYQWRVAGQWCIFCCAVQGLLWLEFFSFLPYLSSTIKLPILAQYGTLFIELSLPVLAWVFIKPFIAKAMQVPELKAQLKSFKYNTAYFNKALNDGVKYTLPDEDHSIILGNREAETIVTMVASPFCGSCATAHTEIETLLASRDDIKVQFIFKANPENVDQKKVAVIEHFMSLKKNADDVSVKHAISTWYKEGRNNYAEWANQHPVATGLFEKELNKILEWCDVTNIRSTPTILINGHKLPKPYRAFDIRYLLE